MQPQKIQDFVKFLDITLKLTRVDENKNNPEWKDANHYKATIKCGNTRQSFYYSQGYGIKEDPKIENILDCLAMDASYDLSSFENFCSEFGYDSDSRKAYKIYKACINNTNKLQKLLGITQLYYLINYVERM